MISFSKYKVILWDFDGVLMDSMPIREEGFKRTLSGYPEEEVSRLLAYHHKNGGLSRYVKFRYFFETVRGESIDNSRIMELAGRFSEVMMELLINEELLIHDALDFVKRAYQGLPMHVVSGSDGVELNKICERLDIGKYFRSIHGSPTPKIQLIAELMQKHGYDPATTVLIGDSVNDHDAAVVNNIDFVGYNNPALNSATYPYIHSFRESVI
jgi:phosphoglycolate phosphatase-like HAD superfamily hydrolase